MTQIVYEAKKDIGYIMIGLSLYILALVCQPLFSGISFLFVFTRLVAFCIIFYGILGLFCAFPVLRKPVKYIKVIIHFLILFAIILFIIVQCLIFSGMKRQDNTPVDFVLVLGAGINGEKPSLMLQSRLDKTIEYLSQNPETAVILCGGQAEDEIIPEALAMFKYLIQNGIDEKILLMEDKSYDTDTNILFAADIIKKTKNIGNVDGINVLIISNEFHLYRAKLIASKQGFNAYGLSAPTPDLPFMRFNYHLREFFSILFTWMGI